MGTLRRNIFLALGSLFTAATSAKTGGSIHKDRAANMSTTPYRGKGSKHNNKTPAKPRWIFMRRSVFGGKAWFRNAATGEEDRFYTGNVGGVHGRPFSFHAKKYFGIKD